MIAAWIFATENPVIIFPKKKIISPFNIREKSPKVIRLIGSVKRFMIGLITTCINVKIAPRIIAVVKVEIAIVGKK